MIRATRALRQSVQNRLVSQYGKSEEYRVSFYLLRTLPVHFNIENTAEIS